MTRPKTPATPAKTAPVTGLALALAPVDGGKLNF